MIVERASLDSLQALKCKHAQREETCLFHKPYGNEEHAAVEHVGAQAMLAIDGCNDKFVAIL